MENLDKYSKWKWLSEPTTIDNSYSKGEESVVSGVAQMKDESRKARN